MSFKYQLEKTLTLSIITMSVSIVYTFWALWHQGDFENVEMWAIFYGALAPAKQMSLYNSWRLLTAPLLHFNLNHLLSNALLLCVSYLIWFKTEEPSIHENDPSPKRITNRLSVYLGGSLYLLAALIGLLRTLLGINTWSIGLSGACLSFFSFVTANRTLSKIDDSLLIKAIFLLSPWIIIFNNLGLKVDTSSHFIGVTIGLISACAYRY